MKKNTMMRIASVLLIAVLMTTCVISGTFAKYTSTFESGASSATVAKWAFKVNNTALAENFAFELFDTIYEPELAEGSLVEDDDVKAGKIAPGTRGSFDIVLKNESEVTANYTITLDETNNGNIPIEYSVDGTNWVEATAFTKSANLTMETGTETITVQWRWVYEAVDPNTNADDTLLGTNATAEVRVIANITVTQVN